MPDLNRQFTAGENLNITTEVTGAEGVVSIYSHCNDSGLNPAILSYLGIQIPLVVGHHHDDQG